MLSFAICCGLSGQQQRDKRCANSTRRCGVFNVPPSPFRPPLLIRMWTPTRCWSTWFIADNRRIHSYETTIYAGWACLEIKAPQYIQLVFAYSGSRSKVNHVKNMSTFSGWSQCQTTCRRVWLTHASCWRRYQFPFLFQHLTYLETPYRVGLHPIHTFLYQVQFHVGKYWDSSFKV